IYRITHTAHKPGPPRPARLGSDSYQERVEAQEAIQRQGPRAVKALLNSTGKARLHAVWAVARAGGPDATSLLFDLARPDPEPRTRPQAVRALADLPAPVLIPHRLDAGPGDAKLAARLAAWAEGKDPRVLLEVVVALGRLRWRDA